MPLLHLAILAMVQGITEFLPVSSSGHLVLLPNLAGWKDQGLNIDVATHVGTLGAVIIYFWRDILTIPKSFILRRRRNLKAARLLGLNILVSLPPVLIAGGCLVYFAPDFFRSPVLIAYTMIIFAIILWVADRTGLTVRRVEHMTIRSAALIGLAQMIALIPGTSRSGITITAARFLGFERAAAARFSMLISIPVIAAAGAASGKELLLTKSKVITIEAGIAAGVAFATALIAIAILMRFLKSYSFTPFIIYRLLLGGALLILYYGLDWPYEIY